VLRARPRHGPAPDPTPWQALTNPASASRPLSARYTRYYERLEPLLDNVQRDAAVMPLVAEMNAYRAHYLEEIREVLLRPWAARGAARAHLLRAIGHALEFRTWQSLVRRQGCTREESVQLMVVFACGVSSPSRSC
jgi:hypothetical protein